MLSVFNDISVEYKRETKRSKQQNSQHNRLVILLKFYTSRPRLGGNMTFKLKLKV